MVKLIFSRTDFEFLVKKLCPGLVLHKKMVCSLILLLVISIPKKKALETISGFTKYFTQVSGAFGGMIAPFEADQTWFFVLNVLN